MQNKDKFFKQFTPFKKPDKKKKEEVIYTAEYNAQRKAHKKAAKQIEEKLTIKPREQWAMYNLSVQKEIKVIELKLKTINKSRNYLYAKLIKYKNAVNDFSHTSFNSVVNTINLSKLNNFKASDLFLNQDKFIINWRAYIIINRQFHKFKKRLIVLNRRLLSFETWIKIVKKFNKNIVKEIVEEGYEFFMGHGLASIRIQRRIRENPEINNPASYQRRKEIIAEGKIPYNKDTAPDGIKWRVYRTERYKFAWYWAKKSVNVKNAYYYTFQPTGGKKGMILYLYNFINENPNHTIKYKY